MGDYKILIYIILIIISLFVFYYNRMLYKKNKAANAYSSLDVILKKRYDLIPNLVKIVNAASSFEKNTLESITKIRRDLLRTDNKEEIFEKNAELTNDLNKLFGLAEAHPDLKANSNYLNLQKELSKIEDQISAARRTYNAHVTRYNNFIQFFPNNFFAILFGFKKLDLFTFEDNIKVEVNMNENSK